MTIGLVIVGSELTTGKRRDKHMAHAIETLDRRGLDLGWCTVLADLPELLTRTLDHSMAADDVVFCFGGIGATPDDHTRQCAAEAARLPLVRHPGAVAAIEARFGEAAYPNRVRMADLPKGAELIPNPINGVPGFSLGDHHFLPGFPEMAWPMLDWVLETRYSALFRPGTRVEYLIDAAGARESELLDLMERFVERFPAIAFSSLPRLREPSPGVELGIRGPPPELDDALTWLLEALKARGYSCPITRREGTGEV